MEDAVNTQLRVAKSKDQDMLLLWVNSLPYKIEIKGNPVFSEDKWNLFFVMPDKFAKEIPSGDLD